MNKAGADVTCFILTVAASCGVLLNYLIYLSTALFFYEFYNQFLFVFARI